MMDPSRNNSMNQNCHAQNSHCRGYWILVLVSTAYLCLYFRIYLTKKCPNRQPVVNEGLPCFLSDGYIYHTIPCPYPYFTFLIPLLLWKLLGVTSSMIRLFRSITANTSFSSWKNSIQWFDVILILILNLIRILLYWKFLFFLIIF